MKPKPAGWKASLALLVFSWSVAYGEDPLTRFRRDTSFYADGSIDYENSDFDDAATETASLPSANFGMMADDRNDVVLEARRKVESDSLEDITDPEYFKEARANAEHIKNMGMLTMRQRSNDNADASSEANSGLASFLATHAVKDDASSEWFNGPDRTVPQLAAGTGEYELSNPPMSPYVDQIPPQPYSVPVYSPQPPVMSVYPGYEYYQPPPQIPYGPAPNFYTVSPSGPVPITAPGSVYDVRAVRPPNSNAVYARAMAVGMQPLGPPLLVNPSGPSLQSQFRPAEYQEQSPQMIGNFGPESYEVLENLGDNATPPLWGPPDRRDGNGQEAPLDDSNLDDLPEPVVEKQSNQARGNGQATGGNIGSNDYFYYNMFGGAANLQGDAVPCPPGRDCSKQPGDVKVVHLPSGKTLKVTTNNQGKINVMIEGPNCGNGGGDKCGPDPQALEEHMKNAIINAANVKEQIAATDNIQPWDMTTTVTVSLGLMLAGIAGVMGYTIMNQRARAAERQDSTTIQSRSNSKVELGQDLSDYCYREDVRRLAHILEDD